MKSIRRYLLVYLIVALTVGSLLVTAFTFVHATQEIDELYDKSMQDIATTLQTQIEALGLDTQEIAGLSGPSLDTKLRHEQEFLIQVWNNHGGLVYTSHRAITFPIQTGRGMVMTEHEQREWRAYVMDTPHFVVQIAQPTKIRTRFVREMALNLLYPMVALIPVIGLFIWFAVGRSLAPLAGISNAIHERSATSLEPLSKQAIPKEIKPMVKELNALLVRLKISLETQKRFTADAAHELRSPLAALQLQLAVLARATDDTERKQAKAKLQQGIDRATHVVQQLLTLARMEPEVAPYTQQVDLAVIVHEGIERYVDHAFQKHIDLGKSRAEPALLAGDANALAIVIGNLIDNALRYTPEGGKVDVCTYMQDQEAVVEIQDTGIGIPETERARIFERFYRVIGTDTDGTGLGLAIVKNIVEQHGGSIIVESGEGDNGTRFTLRFPRIQPPTV